MKNKKKIDKVKRKKPYSEPIFEYRLDESETTALDTVFTELFKIAEQQAIDTLNK